jgi:acetyltransferase-like isoleucine patch superfamily enzyme
MNGEAMSLEIHPTARVSPMADIEASTRGTCIRVGANCVIDSFVKIKSAGGVGDVQIGDRTVINSGCVIYSGNGVLIGADVAIAAGCILAPTNHAFKERDRLIRDQRFLPSRGGIMIEDDVWLGAGCVLLDGAIVRRGAVIGARSLVRGELPAYSISYGDPLTVRGWRE